MSNINNDVLEKIKTGLVQSCISTNPSLFLPFLKNPAVKVDFPNKMRFYSFFKEILISVKEESRGALFLSVEKEPWEKDKNLLAYNFYDQKHQYPRINIQVKENVNSILIGIMPF